MGLLVRKDRLVSPAAAIAALILAPVSSIAAASPQQAAAPPVAAAASDDWALAIPNPPGATLTTEVDARDADVLGLARQLIASVKDTTPRDTPTSSARRSSSQGIRIQIGGPKPPSKPGQARSAHPADAPASDISGGSSSDRGKDRDKDTADGPITAEQLTELVKDIRHIHFVQIRPSDASSDSLLPFYQTAFTTEGGRRVVWSDDGKNARVLMMSFDMPRRGLALVIQPRDLKSAVTVVRTDGYPDMKALAPLIARYLPGTSLSDK